MVALRLQNFGGMIPAVDPRLLPQEQAELSVNTWMYTGSLQGFREPVEIYTCNSVSTKRVFRVPKQYYDKQHIVDSYWLEFDDPDTDVVKSPMASDSYGRYYWASPSTVPQYNTTSRIAAGSSAYTLGIPAPTVAPMISRLSGAYMLDAGTSTYAVVAGSTHLYYSKAYGLDSNSFGSGPLSAAGYEYYGATSISETLNASLAVTFTNGSSNIAGTGLPTTVGNPVSFTTTGTLPTNFSTTATYYIRTGSTSTVMTVATSPGGAAVSAGSAGTGTHAVVYNSGSAINSDKSATPSPETSPKNLYNTTGNRAELRYGTTVAGQRVTISDDGTITNGVPTPITPSTSKPSYEGTGVLESRAYVYTWVSAYGEESPPSPPTVYTGWSGDPWVVKVTAPGNTVTTNRNISKVRIYRTVTSVGGSATYFYVTEMNVSSTAYTDENDNATVSSNDILESIYWTAPPSDLKGLVSMPNGMIAGWRNNEVWFAEPYRPHAWPVAYSVSVDYPIVGMGVIGQTLIVCTTGNPYAISGINPASMAISKIANFEPCMSRGSVISTPVGVAYASSNGLAVAVPGAVSIVSRSMVTKDTWQSLLNLQTLRAAPLNGGYYCWGSLRAGCFEYDTSSTTVSFTNGSATITGVGLPTTVNDGFTLTTTGTLPTNFNTTTTYYVLAGSTSTAITVSTTKGGAAVTAGSAGSGTHTLVYSSGFNDLVFQQDDYTGAYTGAFIDVTNQRVSFNRLTTTDPTYNTITDNWTGEVFVMRDGKVHWIDISSDRTHGVYTWKSKIFEMPNRRNLEAMRVWFSTFDDTPTLNPVAVVSPTTLNSDMYGIMRVYADGILKFSREIRTTGEMFRLPSGFRAQYWQFEIEGRVQINSVEIATAAKELGNV